MCGITGCIDLSGKSSPDVLLSMTETLHHRGPDDSGVRLYPHRESPSGGCTGLGHRRLAVLDISPLGHQPMEKHGLSVVFNGEVYNFREIRDELESLGESFSSHSDTEVILSAFHRWGPEAVHRFIGMFAFALRDSAQQKLYLFRDRAGVKPLYYHKKGGLFLFSSELKAFHRHPAFTGVIDPSSLELFFRYGYIPAPFSIYGDVHKLLPGHFLMVDEKTLEITDRQYWSVFDFSNLPPLDLSMEDAQRELEKILLSAFSYRLVSDVPVGIFLSGGYDSSLVTAMLQKNMTGRLKTFTIGFQEALYNEADHARKVADYLGTDHTEYICTEKEALEIVPQLPFFFDEPFGDASAIPTILVSRLAREQVTVALSADGGDETFAGYGKYELALSYFRRFGRIPSFLRTMLFGILSAVPPESIPFARSRFNFPTKYGKAKMLLKAESILEMLDITSRDFVPDQLSRLIPSLRDSYEAFPASDLLNDSVGPLNGMLAADYRSYMVDDVLVKVDRAAMSVSLEGREPLLDHRIVEFASRLPEEMKLHGNSTKHILREIAHTYVPRHILDRPKMGFAVPVKKWMKSDLKPMLVDYLSRERVAREGILNPREVTAIRDRYLSGESENVNKVWFLLMFQMWNEQWSREAAV